jgi:hypothetical protein
MEKTITFTEFKHPAYDGNGKKCSHCNNIVTDEKAHVQVHKLQDKIDKNRAKIRQLELENEKLEHYQRTPNLPHWSDRK